MNVASGQHGLHISGANISRDTAQTEFIVLLVKVAFIRLHYNNS